jgi:hypothetical protein
MLLLWDIWRFSFLWTIYYVLPIILNIHIFKKRSWYFLQLQLLYMFSQCYDASTNNAIFQYFKNSFPNKLFHIYIGKFSYLPANICAYWAFLYSNSDTLTQNIVPTQDDINTEWFKHESLSSQNTIKERSLMAHTVNYLLLLLLSYFDAILFT